MARLVAFLCMIALAALILAGASTAAASLFRFPANEEFEITSRPDGAGKKAHHLLATYGLGYITCAGLSVQGSATGEEVAQLTLEAVYSECEATVSGPFSFQMGGCAYRFDANGTFAIVDSPGNSCATEPITVGDGACLTSFGPQEHEGAVSYANLFGGPVTEITLSLAFEEFSGEQEGLFCEKGSFADASYFTGSVILKAAKALNPSEAVNLSWE